MLTNRAAERASASVARVGSALVLALIAVTPANAGGVVTLSCIGGSKNLNCVGQYGAAGDPYVRAVPEPLGEEEKAQIAVRERKWMTRCHPVIERDKYGVAHYQYAARGCEYGLGTD